MLQEQGSDKPPTRRRFTRQFSHPLDGLPQYTIAGWIHQLSNPCIRGLCNVFDAARPFRDICSDFSKCLAAFDGQSQKHVSSKAPCPGQSRQLCRDADSLMRSRAETSYFLTKYMPGCQADHVWKPHVIAGTDILQPAFTCLPIDSYRDQVRETGPNAVCNSMLVHFEAIGLKPQMCFIVIPSDLRVTDSAVKTHHYVPLTFSKAAAGDKIGREKGAPGQLSQLPCQVASVHLYHRTHLSSVSGFTI